MKYISKRSNSVVFCLSKFLFLNICSKRFGLNDKWCYNEKDFDVVFLFDILNVFRQL